MGRVIQQIILPWRKNLGRVSAGGHPQRVRSIRTEERSDHNAQGSLKHGTASFPEGNWKKEVKKNYSYKFGPLFSLPKQKKANGPKNGSGHRKGVG